MIQAKDKFMQIAIDEALDGIFEGRDKLNDYMIELDRKACLELFDEYVNMQHKIY